MGDTTQLSAYLARDRSLNITDIFDEEKCRNVLVRYCAHIPRNYQYRDGIRLVFLVLRDHLGDEFLGYAGGVLYEMIEVDCHHSDDPARSSLYPSGIGIRKNWMIEHTMYVSSRDGGTRAFRQLKAREFHEMQWNENMIHKGRLVGEKLIDLGELPKRRATETHQAQTERSHHRRSLSSKIISPEKMTQIIHMFRVTDKGSGKNENQKPALVQDDHSIILTHDAFKQQFDAQVRDCEIPNANFARKFGLFTSDRSLPPFIRELPVAEDKAMDMLLGFEILGSMQQESSNRGRYSDPSAAVLTPLRGDFLDISPGFESRARSLSPRKRLVKQPLHIRMNLTESQVDKITDAFSHQVDKSPTKAAKFKKKSTMATPRTTPRSTPRKNKPRLLQHEDSYGWTTREDGPSDVNSPTFSELMPGRHSGSSKDLFSASLAERRHINPPSPLQLGNIRRSGAVPRPAEMEDIPDSVSPLGQGRFEREPIFDDDASSVYSPQQTARPSPLRLSHARSQSKFNGAGEGSFQEWKRSHDSSMIRESVSHPEDLVNRPRRSKSSADGLRQARAIAVHSPPIPQVVTVGSNNSNYRRAVQDTPVFSPLQFYFRGTDYPSSKKGEKIMIGDNGWLERPDGRPDQSAKTPQKKTGILDNIKKLAKDMTVLHYTSRRAQPNVRSRPTSQVAISLNAREQSLLYCELEFNLSTALNNYITVQLDKGRLVPDKLKKVADAWHNKGRPKVVGFRYDLETQLELINLHADDFRFYGRRQADPVEIGGLLHAMKVNARAMCVRTLCQPDSVIAKQLVDTQSTFKMIDVPDYQQRALADIAQFFKVIVEREQDAREHTGGNGRDSSNRGERRWTAVQEGI
ncbi:hypothetical protein FAGAP_11844 [Fusarium agapanthi]|uniref:Uncharacterized protein n=1 Tax=Fusarium agapanthi TaxID=1803897 RepID=A0A9P5AYB0_9HYPO|nr:hypothetical protein FAGAP_11844 [Fusarium agapanthi]